MGLGRASDTPHSERPTSEDSELELFFCWSEPPFTLLLPLVVKNELSRGHTHLLSRVLLSTGEQSRFFFFFFLPDLTSIFPELEVSEL